ncbi:hypothetical protein ACTXPS_18255 [Brachybacterium tyrofermentans]
MSDTSVMDLSWELEQLGRSAEPDVVLEGSRLVHRVSDVLLRDDYSMQALVRGEAPQVVTVPGRHTHDAPTCTCGAARRFRHCAHVIAASLRYLQIHHGLDDARVERWERYVEARRDLSAAWKGLAGFWLESRMCGDEGASAAVFHDADSLDAHIQIARGLVGKASSEQLSTFLVELAAYHGINDRSLLGNREKLDAVELTYALFQPFDPLHPEADTAAILAIIGSVRRTLTVSGVEWALDVAGHDVVVTERG